MTPIVLAYVALLVWGVFITSYWALARWWESDTGINIMGVSIVLWGHEALIVAQNAWPDYALRPYAQVVVYGGAIVFGVQRTVQMVRAQLHRRKDRR